MTAPYPDDQYKTDYGPINTSEPPYPDNGFDNPAFQNQPSVSAFPDNPPPYVAAADDPFYEPGADPKQDTGTFTMFPRLA